MAKSGKYYEPWREKPEDDFEVFKNGKRFGKVADFKVQWKGEERVFDTWMDSSISELVNLKYISDRKFFDKNYPCSLRPQGKEIIRTWLYYSLLRGYLETGKMPFENVWINQHIVDSFGNKMSKSKGNIIDPQKLLKDYGAEAIRLWAATEGDLSQQDIKCSEERIKAELKTVNKLLNVSKFITQFKKPKTKPKLTETDEIFVDHMDWLIAETDESYAKYDFYHPALILRGFLWDLLASHYLELVKARAYNQEKKFSPKESESARYTLYYILENFLTLIYPIMPQICTVLGSELGLKFENLASRKVKTNIKIIDSLTEFNSFIWKTKKEKGISLREPLSNVKIPTELKLFEKDLIAAHNLI